MICFCDMTRSTYVPGKNLVPCRPGVVAGLSVAEEEGIAVMIDPQLASMCWARFRWGVGMVEECNAWECRLVPLQ